MRTLLVPTDFSEPAQLAVERAALLASAHPGAALTLVHVTASPGVEVVLRMFGQAGDEVEARMTSEASHRLSELAEDLRRRHGCTVHTHVRAGRAVREIAAAVESADASLVVMGARGENPARDFLLGNTTDRVLRKVKAPLIAVRRPASGPYSRVLVAVDFSDYSLAAAKLAAKLFPAAEIALVHAYEVAFEQKFRHAGAAEDLIESYRRQARRTAEAGMEKLMAGLAESGVRPRQILVHGSPAPAILHHARDLEADLVVIGKYGESMLGDMLMGSTTRRVLVSAQTDVLVTSESAETS